MVNFTACLFTVTVWFGGGLWQVEVGNAGHNHEPHVHVSAHQYGRWLMEEQNVLVLTLGRAGVAARRTINSLLQNDGIVSTAQDIYDIRMAELNVHKN